MKLTLEYEETPYLQISSIAVIGSFNNYDLGKGKMQKSGDKWIVECEVKPGQNLYKFLINENIKLNDPMANLYLPDDKGELWSVIMMDETGSRLYNNTDYTVHIENYNITNNINQKQMDNKKEFNTLLDKKVVTRFEFTNVTGLHSVTAVWFNPYGEQFDFAENMLFTPEDHGEEPIMIWFMMDLQNNDYIYPEGLWTMRLFIDGTFILEDKFSVSKMNTYSQHLRTYTI